MRTYFLTVIESHIRTEQNREAGVRNETVAFLQGDADLIRFAVDQLIPRLRPDQEYLVYFLGHDRPFGTAVTTILSGSTPGVDAPRQLTEAAAKL